MRLDHLKYLLYVKKYHSINAAAKALYISQPSLSSAITAFEKEIGYAIFERSHLGAFPTKKGAQLLAEAESVYAVISNWIESPENNDIHRKTTIRIWATPALSDSILINVILHLEEKYSYLEILLDNYRTFGNHSIKILDEFPKTKANFILYAHSSDNLSFLKNYGLQYQLIGRDNYVAFICADNPLAEKSTLSMSDFSDYNLATYSNYLETFHYISFFDKYPPNKIYTFSTREQIMQVVSQNKALAFFPKISAINDYYITTGLIKPLKISNFLMPVTYYIAYPEKNTLSHDEKIVFSAILAEFEKIDHFLEN